MNENQLDSFFSSGSRMLEELTKLARQLNLLSSQLTTHDLTGKTSAVSEQTFQTDLAIAKSKKDEENSTDKMLNDFEAMLGFTGRMLEDIGLMDAGFGKILQSILGFIGSLSGGGDLVSSIGGIFGTIISLFTGAAGITPLTAGALINSPSSINSFGSHQNTARPVIVQNTIKNPVTFRRALEIETRVINNLSSVTAG